MKTNKVITLILGLFLTISFLQANSHEPFSEPVPYDRELRNMFTDYVPFSTGQISKIEPLKGPTNPNEEPEPGFDGPVEDAFLPIAIGAFLYACYILLRKKTKQSTDC